MKSFSFRRFLCLLLSCLALASFFGCGSAVPSADDGLTVICTIFPLYDWTREIMGNSDGPRLELLLSNGVDMHSYQPSVDDMVRISTCDLLIYVGGESDAWVEEALAGANGPKPRALNLMAALGEWAKPEETVEGMQAGEEEETANDEHIWLSLRNAAALCAVIRDALKELDPANASAYEKNAADYRGKLEALDAEFTVASAAGGRDTLVFADRYPFRYLLDDYSLRYYAAFSGCEAETEASFETVAFLAGKAEELELRVLLTTESPVPRLAETILENCGRKGIAVLPLDSMQSLTAAQTEAGETYLGIMEKNLAVLREALQK